MRGLAWISIIIQIDQPFMRRVNTGNQEIVGTMQGQFWRCQNSTAQFCSDEASKCIERKINEKS